MLWAWIVASSLFLSPRLLPPTFFRNISWAFASSKVGFAGKPALSPRGDIVLATSYDHVLHAINVSTGREVWNHTGVCSGSTTSSLADLVYVGSGSGEMDAMLLALNGSDGHQLWTCPIGDLIDWSSSPALSASQEVIYVGSRDNRLYAVNASNGQQLWNYTTDARIACPSPVLNRAQDVVYLASWDHRVYSLSASHGDQLWNYTTGAGVNIAPVLSPQDDVIYIASADHNLYCLNASSGGEVWRYTMELVMQSLALNHIGDVLYAGDQHRLYALNASAAFPVA